MSAKEQAFLDIQEELSKTSKSFIAFRTDLNPVMNALVRQHIKKQKGINPRPAVTSRHTNSQLVAQCFFCKGDIKFDNYRNYYK